MLLFHWMVHQVKGIDSDMAVGRYCLEVEIAPKTAWSRQVGVDLGTGVGVHPGKEVGADLEKQEGADLEKEMWNNLGKVVKVG